MGMMIHRNKKRRAVKKAALEQKTSPVQAEESTVEKPTHTKTEINRMSVAELREMATNTGVEGADTMTGIELKEYFISLYGL